MSPSGLMKAAHCGKAVTGILPTSRPMPAAFVVSMQFRFVMDRLKDARIYRPKHKPKKKFTWPEENQAWLESRKTKPLPI